MQYHRGSCLPAVLPTGLPSCRPAFRPAYRLACRPAFLPTSLPACQFVWLSSRRHVFFLSRSCLPACRTTSFYFSMPTYCHADGCGRTFSPLLDLPACLPAGSPFSTLNIFFSLPSCPACRTTSFYFSMTHLSFFLCRHAVMPKAGPMPSLISWTFLPACLPDHLFQVFILPLNLVRRLHANISDVIAVSS